MINATIEYICDHHDDEAGNQNGHITITTPTGRIMATWSATGGMGDGCELSSNTTTELSDDDAVALLDNPDLCQGDGTYRATITDDLQITNVEWVG